MKRYFPFFLISFVLSAFPMEAQKLPPFIMPSARASALGGNHAAQGDDFSSIFSNPAAFAGIEKQFSAAEISLGVTGPIFEMIDTAIRQSGDISTMIATEDFALGFDVGGPIALGFVNNGFGFGFFNRTVMDIETLPFIPMTMPRLKASAWEEVFLVGGYSFRVLDRERHKLDIGVLGKAYYRLMLALEDDADVFFGAFGSFMSIPLQTHFGMGFDLGIRYSFNDMLTVAISGYDVYSPALVTTYPAFSDYPKTGTQSYNTVQPRLAVGALFRYSSEFLERYISEIAVMLDYNDFFFLFLDPGRHPLLNLSLGLEITMLKILKLRAGMAEVLPSGGFGIDMTFMILDVGVRGRQLGKKIGEKSAFAMDIGFLFRY